MSEPLTSSAKDTGRTTESAAWIFLKQILFSRRWLIIPPIAVGLFVFYLMVASKRGIPRTDVPEQTVKVAVIEAQAEVMRSEVVGYGTAQASGSWTAIAEVSGRIQVLHPNLDSGNWINAGETLLQIDDQDYKLRLAQKQADLSSAEASISELEASQAADLKSLEIEKDLLVVSQKDVDRVKRLRKVNAVSTSEIELAEGNLLRQDQAIQRLENTLSLYPSKIASAEARVAMTESIVQEAQRNIDRTLIKSPISGVVSGFDLEIGQVLNTNQQLFQIQDNKNVEVETQISLSQLNQLLVGFGKDVLSMSRKELLSKIRAEIVTESGSQSYRWSGKPVRITESIDAHTRTVGVVVAVTNEYISSFASGNTTKNLKAVSSDQPTGSAAGSGQTSDEGKPLPNNRIPLKPGIYCEVRLYGEFENQQIALPRTAFDGDQVYIADSEDRLQVRPVKQGFGIGDRIIIRSGIEEGDRVLVRPPSPAIEGMKLKLQ